MKKFSESELHQIKIFITVENYYKFNEEEVRRFLKEIDNDIAEAILNLLEIRKKRDWHGKIDAQLSMLGSALVNNSGNSFDEFLTVFGEYYPSLSKQF